MCVEENTYRNIYKSNSIKNKNEIKHTHTHTHNIQALYISMPGDQDEVDILPGIGKVYKQKLNSLGIYTVKDLANVSSSQITEGIINYEKYQSLVKSAKNYLSLHQNRLYATPDTKEDDYDQYYSIHHSWYEVCAQIVDIDHREVKKVIISELHFDPNQRITFLCSWVEKETVLCERSYSPQYLRLLTPTLPELHVQLSNMDIKGICLQSLIKTLEEVNTIYNIQQQQQQQHQQQQQQQTQQYRS